MQSKYVIAILLACFRRSARACAMQQICTESGHKNDTTYGRVDSLVCECRECPILSCLSAIVLIDFTLTA